MAGNDIDRENEASSPVNITGADETHKVDVIQDTDGFRKIYTKTTLTDGDVSISSGLRIVEDQNQLSLSNNTYQVAYQKNVANVCTGAMFKFSGSGAKVKLEIDGILIFEVELDFLNGFVNWNNSGNPSTTLSYNSSANVFYFRPNLPIKAANSTVFSVEGPNNRKLEGYYIEVAEL